MTTYGPERQRRLEIRISLEEKRVLEKLATVYGLSASEVVRQLIKERFSELKTEAA